ncbi:hypothetical protein [Oceanobacillus neutriphilus]|uniref:YhfM-like domain-containing protein n=1 Tax=Oceanobacillus neutriphilus TaxID=531815 RepID=A0ABQ2NZU3_9BACI|nr:hypothetical protein [Oceanobacillus neutriphilus]GGP14732.1 hypothetical protein GCM10011346_39880 [Oceanobacillus neutriphilus]
MNLRFLFIVLISFSLAFALMGCQLKKEMPMIETYDINAISISESTSFGKFNNDFFKTISDRDRLDTLKNALVTAEKETAKLEDVNYDLLVNYGEDGDQLLKLYLGEEGEQSAFFYLGYEDRVYFMSKEKTRELREILNP